MTPKYLLQLVFLLLMLNTPVLANNAPAFHSVTVSAGDGVLSLMRRYGLDNSKCNVDKFYTLNNLDPGAPLKKDDKYVVPIYIYQYNGKSIRSTIGVNDWEKAMRIKEYNEMLVKSNLRSTSYIDSKQLWVPFSELHCSDINKTVVNGKGTVIDLNKGVSKKDGKVTKAEVVQEELFGKYSKFRMKDRSLENKVYYIVSGHGGPDPGARCTTCPNTLCEDEYAYDVSLRLVRELKSKGATVHMIIQDANDGIRDEKYLVCDKDETCLGKLQIPLNQFRRLEQRAEAINTLYEKYKSRGITEQYAIMIHVDSRSEDKRQDVYFYHYEHSDSSKKLANSLQNTFETKYAEHQKGRGYSGFVTSRNLYMIRNTMPTAVYIELANIRNPLDQKRLLLHSNREALANWIADGLVAGGQ